MRLFLRIIIGLCVSFPAFAQDLKIQIKDAASKASVPFAAIRFGNSAQGVIADLYGNADVPTAIPDGFIEVSALGYESKSVPAPVEPLVYIAPKKSTLGEFVVRPDDDKIRRIIRRTIAARDRHNPEKYDWYRCHVYYKMRADAYPRDSAFKNDTSKDAASFAQFMERQHLIVSETYSIRSWKRPQKLQEEIVASRFSGFKKSMLNGLVTDILPFHAYADFIKLNGKDYRNPISRGAEQWYNFNLSDEILNGNDTVWIISFFPKKAGDVLRGLVYISSDGYAISNFIGSHKDAGLGNSVRIEQQYRKVGEHWFPAQLNYVFELMQHERKDGVGLTMQGSSRIDSVSFSEDPKFRFDKVHTVKLRQDADLRNDSVWTTLRPESLNGKESQTYIFMDSVMEEAGAERFLSYMPKLLEAKFPIGPVDLNIDRLFMFNNYEGNRFGLGLQTNEALTKHASLGAWAGYGAHDKVWKYGAFGEAYLDRYKETSIRFGYEYNLRDPGRVQLHRELDRNYLRNYLMTRGDLYEAFTINLRKRFGYFQTELDLRRENVFPQYPYQWAYDGQLGGNYGVNEASLSVRYAFGERSAPLFGKYLPTGTKFPIVYARLTQGQLDIASRTIGYTQAVAGISWQKHIARIGLERWMVHAGASVSNAPLPLGKVFGAPGVHHDKYRVFVFGGLQTVYPYTFFADRYLSWSWRHEFDWKFYNVDIGAGFGSAPGLALACNGYWGSLQNREAHVTLPFRTAENGYHEAGIMLQNLLRIRYMNLYYIGLGGGYFQPLDGTWDPKAGTYAITASVSL